MKSQCPIDSCWRVDANFPHLPTWHTRYGRTTSAVVTCTFSSCFQNNDLYHRSTDKNTRMKRKAASKIARQMIYSPRILDKKATDEKATG